jgi:hypothetical protein
MVSLWMQPSSYLQRFVLPDSATLRTKRKAPPTELMTIEYTIDHERKVILETWLGAVTASELANYWRHILADPEILAIRRTLVDLRNASTEFTGAELASMVESIVIPALGGRSWKSALLIEKPVQLGVSRQYHVFAETYSQDAVFHDPEAAMRWLLG